MKSPAIPRSVTTNGSARPAAPSTLTPNNAASRSTCRISSFVPGDFIDVAFTVGHNDHPEYGGLELSLRDFKMVEGKITAAIRQQ